MLTYLLIAFVLVVALVPLTHFAPSKRQRQIARMREAAAVGGLFVELRPLPAPLQRGAPPPRDLIYYGKRLPPNVSSRIDTLYWRRDGDEWRSADRRGPVPDVLQSLPQAVWAASTGSQGVGVYWVESEAEEQVERILEVLDSWAQELSG